MSRESFYQNSKGFDAGLIDLFERGSQPSQFRQNYKVAQDRLDIIWIESEKRKKKRIIGAPCTTETCTGYPKRETYTVNQDSRRKICSFHGAHPVYNPLPYKF